jgi:hypothetical protein
MLAMSAIVTKVVVMLLPAQHNPRNSMELVSHNLVHRLRSNNSKPNMLCADRLKINVPIKNNQCSAKEGLQAARWTKDN